MTQEWINQYNKKCAEFLGWKPNKHSNGSSDDFYDNPQIYSSDLKFHSDWNWIMEICIKISSLCSDDAFEELNGRVFRFKHSMFWELIEDKNKFLLKIEEFIDWYNKQKE